MARAHYRVISCDVATMFDAAPPHLLVDVQYECNPGAPVRKVWKFAHDMAVDEAVRRALIAVDVEANTYLLDAERLRRASLHNQVDVRASVTRKRISDGDLGGS